MTATFTIDGGGVAGLLAAVELQRRGRHVIVRSGPLGASWHAGGMLAPSSELDRADPSIAVLGQDAVERWTAIVGDDQVLTRGTLHVAHRPEWPMLTQLADRIRRAGRPVEVVDSERIGQLEPLLAGRFRRGLYLADEGAVDPEPVLRQLTAQILAGDGEFVDPLPPGHAGIDARGLGDRQDLGLRGVRGEYVVVRSPLQLSRAVRLAHPRYPLYIVPRAESLVYVGATELEREDSGPIEVRSSLELLSALYSLHPDFGDAAIVRQGAALRPATPDNHPTVVRKGNRVTFNGLYRHGYLLGPVLAERAVDLLLETP